MVQLYLDFLSLIFFVHLLEVIEYFGILLNKTKKEDFLSSDQEDESGLLEDGQGKKAQTGKTDDPVRLYLKDMGGVELCCARKSC